MFKRLQSQTQRGYRKMGKYMARKAWKKLTRRWFCRIIREKLTEE
jgi:hypothetical protein